MGATFFASSADHFISALTSYSSLLPFSSSPSSSSSSMVDVSPDLSFPPTSSSSPHFHSTTQDPSCDHDSKRRKSQQKRVVYVPINADSKQKCEAPPSDLWAWRKYGQKPIKGSPYPRGYYKCSSSKGCSARKQVERSRTDPSMLIITYMTEHNHLCSGSSSPAIARPFLYDPCQQEPTIKSKHHLADLEPPEELFPGIINSPTSTDHELMDFLETPPQPCSIFPTDEDLCFSRSISEDEDFFHDLGELPELATMFAKGHHQAQDTFAADWSSNKLLLSS